jgi:hypothetical protein
MTNRTRRSNRFVIYSDDAAISRPGSRAAASARRQALRDLSDEGTVVYAIRQNCGLIKIGVTTNIARRSQEIGTEVLGFFFGDYDDEQAIHHSLRAHVAKGREYYHVTPEVIAVVNDMRTNLGLPLIAA